MHLFVSLELRVMQFTQQKKAQCQTHLKLLQLTYHEVYKVKDVVQQDVYEVKDVITDIFNCN